MDTQKAVEDYPTLHFLLFVTTIPDTAVVVTGLWSLVCTPTAQTNTEGMLGGAEGGSLDR